MLGAGSVIKQVLLGITGMISEPIKGAKKDGLKGIGKGIGKGLVGLVFKPMAGSFDLVTYTARGMENMGGTVYRNLFHLKNK